MSFTLIRMSVHCFSLRESSSETGSTSKADNGLATSDVSLYALGLRMGKLKPAQRIPIKPDDRCQQTAGWPCVCLINCKLRHI